MKGVSPGAQPRCRTVARCGDSEKCLKLTACGDAARVRHRSIHRDRPALPPRVVERSGAGIGRQSACSPLSPKPARGRVCEGAKVLRSGSRAITRRWSGLAIRSSGVVNRLAASRSTPALSDRYGVAICGYAKLARTEARPFPHELAGAIRRTVCDARGR